MELQAHRPGDGPPGHSRIVDRHRHGDPGLPRLLPLRGVRSTSRASWLGVGIPLVLAAVLALFLQVASNNKYAGFLLMILYFISGPTLQALDFNHLPLSVWGEHRTRPTRT